LPGLKNRGRSLAGGLLLAAVATPAVVTAAVAATAVAPPSAVAAPAAVTAAGAPLSSVPLSSATPGNGKPPGGEITWSAVGATPKGPNGRYQFSYNNIKPGTVINDWVELYNRGTTAAAFAVYGADATGTTLSNSLTYDEVGTKPKDIGTWVTFYNSATLPHAAQASFVMPGGHGIIEPFTVTVPPTATPGDHTGGLMVQVGVPRTNSAGQRVIVYSRIALPILLRVTGPFKTGMQVQSVSTSFSTPLNPFGPGNATVSYTVANTGNVRITGTQLVKVAGVFATSKTTPPHLPTILPGDAIRITATARGLYPAGPMDATVTVTTTWPVSELPLKLTLPVATAGASLFAVPWTLLALIAALAGAGYGVWRLLKWRARQHAADLAAVAAQATRETERRLRDEAKAGAGTTASGTASSAGDATPPSPGDPA